MDSAAGCPGSVPAYGLQAFWKRMESLCFNPSFRHGMERGGHHIRAFSGLLGAVSVRGLAQGPAQKPQPRIIPIGGAADRSRGPGPRRSARGHAPYVLKNQWINQCCGALATKVVSQTRG